MSVTSGRVVIGMDPHKRSATIEVMAGDERIVGGGRFGADRSGYAAMTTYASRWPNRVWTIEGCQGIGRHALFSATEPRVRAITATESDDRSAADPDEFPVRRWHAR